MGAVLSCYAFGVLLNCTKAADSPFLGRLLTLTNLHSFEYSLELAWGVGFEHSISLCMCHSSSLTSFTRDVYGTIQSDIGVRGLHCIFPLLSRHLTVSSWLAGQTIQNTSPLRAYERRQTWKPQACHQKNQLGYHVWPNSSHTFQDPRKHDRLGCWQGWFSKYTISVCDTWRIYKSYAAAFH